MDLNKRSYLYIVLLFISCIYLNVVYDL